MRLWLKGDTWASGSTMPQNGYGIEVNENTNELLLRGRQNNNSTILDRTDLDFNEDWHWMRFRVEGDELSVRLWDDESEEPEDWEIEYQLQENEEIENDAGYFLLSAINFDYNNNNTFYFDEITVKDLDEKSDSTEQEPVPEQKVKTENETPKHDEDGGEKSTIHLSVNDSDGNIVSYTTTIVSIGGN